MQFYTASFQLYSVQKKKQARDCPCEKRLYFLQHKGKDLIDHNKLSLYVIEFWSNFISLPFLMASQNFCRPH